MNIYEEHQKLFNRYYKFFKDNEKSKLELFWHDLKSLKNNVLKISEFCFYRKVVEWNDNLNNENNFKFGSGI